MYIENSSNDEDNGGGGDVKKIIIVIMITEYYSYIQKKAKHQWLQICQLKLKHFEGRY